MRVFHQELKEKKIENRDIIEVAVNDVINQKVEEEVGHYYILEDFNNVNNNHKQF